MSQIKVGFSTTITAVSHDVDGAGAPLALSDVTYASSNTDVATVSSGGVVKGIAPGTVRISVTGTLPDHSVAVSYINFEIVANQLKLSASTPAYVAPSA